MPPPPIPIARTRTVRDLALKFERDPGTLQDSARKACDLLKALGNVRRLMIVCELLRQGEVSVGDLATRLDMGQSALSQHLARLRVLGLVATRREAQTIYYALASQEAVALIGTLYELYCAPSGGPKRRHRR